MKHQHTAPSPTSASAASRPAAAGGPCSLLATRYSLLSLTALCLLTSVLISGGATPLPELPRVAPTNIRTYAWIWDGQAWRELPNNAARILDCPSGQCGKQLTGTLTIDGYGAVPSAPGQNVLLACRSSFNLKTYKGLPEGESAFEVTRLEVKPGPGKKQLIRTARLMRLGEAAATFGDKRELIAVQKSTNDSGIYHLIQVRTPLEPGRYALNLPDRAYEFEIAEPPPRLDNYLLRPAEADAQPEANNEQPPASDE